MPYVNKPRPYDKEYEEYQGTEEQKKKRAVRNAARRKLMASGDVQKGDGKDVAHKVALSKGGTNAAGNLKAEDANSNRSFARSSNKKLVSEVSKRERKNGNSR